MYYRKKEGVYTNPDLEYINADGNNDDQLQSNYPEMSDYDDNYPQTSSNYFNPYRDGNEEAYPTTSGSSNYFDPGRNEEMEGGELAGETTGNGASKLNTDVRDRETSPMNWTIKDIGKRQKKYHFGGVS